MEEEEQEGDAMAMVEITMEEAEEEDGNPMAVAKITMEEVDEEDEEEAPTPVEGIEDQFEINA